MGAHNLTEGQARAVAAIALAESGSQVDAHNSDAGGHGANGLFQIRDSGGLKEMTKLYGDHPTMQQQVDFFLQRYSKGNSAFWNASSEADAFRPRRGAASRAGGNARAVRARRGCSCRIDWRPQCRSGSGRAVDC
jgi:hypothetical protein